MKPTVIHAVSLITRSLWVRFHMALILLALVLAGVAVSWLLLHVGVRSMAARYVASVLIGYLLFFFGVRLWLCYTRRALPDLDRHVLAVHEGAQPAFARSHGWDGECDYARPFAWVSDALCMGGDGCLIGALATFILFALCGASIYVIATAPAFLGEAVVQLVLAAALRRKGKSFDGEHWSGSVLRATWGPALIVLTLAAVTGFFVQGSCPSAVSLFGAITQCRP